MMSKSKKVLQCNVCDKTFSLVGNLNQHKRIHEEFSNVKCRKCRSTFTRPDLLKRHMQYVHCPVKMRTCSFCNKRFKNKDWCKTHELSHSSHQLAFECDKCGQHFTRKYNLARHIQRNCKGQSTVSRKSVQSVRPAKTVRNCRLRTSRTSEPQSTTDTDDVEDSSSSLRTSRTSEPQSTTVTDDVEDSSSSPSLRTSRIPEPKSTTVPDDVEDSSSDEEENNNLHSEEESENSYEKENVSINQDTDNENNLINIDNNDLGRIMDSPLESIESENDIDDDVDERRNIVAEANEALKNFLHFRPWYERRFECPAQHLSDLKSMYESVKNIVLDTNLRFNIRGKENIVTEANEAFKGFFHFRTWYERRFECPEEHLLALKSMNESIKDIVLDINLQFSKN